MLCRYKEQCLAHLSFRFHCHRMSYVFNDIGNIDKQKTNKSVSKTHIRNPQLKLSKILPIVQLSDFESQTFAMT